MTEVIYKAVFEGRSANKTYFKVTSSRSNAEYPVSVTFECTCPYHSLHPDDRRPCKVVKAVFQELFNS